MLHYYKFKDITKNPLLQENLLNKKSVFRVLSTISRDSTITRYTITSVDCIYILTYLLTILHTYILYFKLFEGCKWQLTWASRSLSESWNAPYSARGTVSLKWCIRAKFFQRLNIPSWIAGFNLPGNNTRNLFNLTWSVNILKY